MDFLLLLPSPTQIFHFCFFGCGKDAGQTQGEKLMCELSCFKHYHLPVPCPFGITRDECSVFSCCLEVDGKGLSLDLIVLLFSSWERTGLEPGSINSSESRCVW